MKDKELGLLLFALAWMAGCSAARTSPPTPRSEEPSAFTKKEREALYYYDLGPDSIDVSHYPKRQQDNYAVFAQVCSRCHTLARPINSPRDGYWAWDYYIFNMRLRSQFKPGTAFTKEQAERILDFLTYDSKIRKGKNREEFEHASNILQRRFDRMIEERVHRMQEGRPLLPHDR